MKMKQKLTIVIGLSACAAGLLLMSSRNLQTPPKEASAEPLVPTVTQKPTLQTEPSVLASSVSENKVSAQIPAATGSAINEVPIPYAQELKDYLSIRNKVFMSDTEKILRKSFLNDARMLVALGDYLNTPGAMTTDSEQAHNAATDILLEALSGDKREVAAMALQAVIADKGVEDPQLSPPARQALAGTKAEVLYQWSALEPAKAEQMQSWLPGPVSQKIWKNVRQAQNQNLAESGMVAGK